MINYRRLRNEDQAKVNAKWYLGLVLETNKKIYKKTDKTQIKGVMS